MYACYFAFRLYLPQRSLLRRKDKEAIRARVVECTLGDEFSRLSPRDDLEVVCSGEVGVSVGSVDGVFDGNGANPGNGTPHRRLWLIGGGDECELVNSIPGGIAELEMIGGGGLDWEEVRGLKCESSVASFDLTCALADGKGFGVGAWDPTGSVSGATAIPATGSALDPFGRLFESASLFACRESSKVRTLDVGEVTSSSCSDTSIWASLPG